MQPSATLMQMITALSGVCIAGAAITFTVHTWSDSRNAQLVQIGVGILEIDPGQQKQVKAAREWALDLIEANAGGVRFSKEARAQLLDKPLVSGSPFLSAIAAWSRPGRQPQASQRHPARSLIPAYRLSANSDCNSACFWAVSQFEIRL